MATIFELNEKHNKLMKLKSQLKCLGDAEPKKGHPTVSIWLNGVSLDVHPTLYQNLRSSAMAHLHAQIEEFEDYFRAQGIQV